MGDVTFKEVAGGAGGVASTVSIPQYKTNTSGKLSAIDDLGKEFDEINQWA